ncbi:QueT transporter family protein [Enorma sp.]|uniref:QueT transporter family protein n=1 Tax=Enorma sp. TaxID=1920692 RepID=UPI003AB7933E
MLMKSNEIAQVGVIAAVYAACTLIALLFLGSLAWGPVQFRVSEALCVLALFTPAAVPGLTLGCAIANIANIAFSGTGMLGLLDVVFGSLATCAGAAFTWKMRERPAVALAGPVIANALIVPAYLPILLQATGFYTIPFTSISLDGTWPFMYLFGLVATGVGEAVIMYVLGYPLGKSLARTPYFKASSPFAHARESVR